MRTIKDLFCWDVGNLDQILFKRGNAEYFFCLLLNYYWNNFEQKISFKWQDSENLLFNTDT